MTFPKKVECLNELGNGVSYAVAYISDFFGGANLILYETPLSRFI